MFSKNANLLAAQCATHPEYEDVRRVLADAILDCGDEYADIAKALRGPRGQQYAVTCNYMLKESGQPPDALAFYFVVRHLVPMADKQAKEREEREEEQANLIRDLFDSMNRNGQRESNPPNRSLCLACAGRVGNMNCNWCNGTGRIEL